ncbi:MAG: LytR/AlgR family response regulator transcription factor [Bacillota bacterium]
MRCLIIDDEAPAREELRYLLDKLEGVEVVGEAESGSKAFEIIESMRIDVVFLDIQMRGMNGFEVAKKLLQMERPPLIVFVSAYDEFAIKAFEINAVDYVLKPVAIDRLKNTVSRLLHLRDNYRHETDINLLRLIENMTKPIGFQKICVYYNGKNIPLDPREIVFIVSEGRNTVIKTQKGQYTSNLTLSELEEKLQGYNFFRCHRSYLINLHEISEIDHWFHGTYQVTMNGFSEDKIPVSRNNVNTFKSIMNL